MHFQQTSTSLRSSSVNFPYVTKRLLADDSLQAKDALRNLLYGAEQYMEPNRLAHLADGFATYTTTTKFFEEHETGEPLSGGISLSNRNTATAEAAVTLAKDSADISFLAPGGNFVQSLLVMCRDDLPLQSSGDDDARITSSCYQHQMMTVRSSI